MGADDGARGMKTQLLLDHLYIWVGRLGGVCPLLFALVLSAASHQGEQAGIGGFIGSAGLRAGWPGHWYPWCDPVLE
jgi:hypothetical protein